MNLIRRWFDRWIYNRAISLFWRSHSYRDAAEIELRHIRAAQCGHWITSMYD